MTEAIPEFGERVAGLAYRRRPSAYAVVIDEDGRVLVCAVDGELHLPGGGIEVGESPGEAVVREVREETGLLVSVGCELGVARQYVSKRAHYLKTGHFYAAAVAGRPGGAIEDDHEVVWMPAERAASDLEQGFHRWAVERAVTDRRLPSSPLPPDHR
jgi:8-oxo-dGTP diphosphatase